MKQPITAYGYGTGRTKHVSFRTTPELFRKWSGKAARAGLSLSAWIVRKLEDSEAGEG